VQGRLADNAAAVDVFALQFKLRLDQRQDHTVWSYQLESPRQDQSQRNKGNVDHAKIDILRNMFVRKKARVEFLHYHDAWVVSDFPGELAVPNVDRENFGCAALQ